MSSRADKGAVPEVFQAMVESDIHHLREQSDMDRRRFAQRLNEDRLRLEKIDEKVTAQGLQLARVADAAGRLERTAEAHGKTHELVLESIAKAKGGIKVLTWLVGSGIGLEVIRLVVEHAK